MSADQGPDSAGSTSQPHLPTIRIVPEKVVVARVRTTQDRIADRITSFAGTLTFVYIHAAWFVVWITVNLGAFGARAVFDRYPFGLLTMIVSLEAIFLSTFVMVSQNRQAARENVRADLDFENNVRSEVWSAHIGAQLGIDPHVVDRRVQEIIRLSKAEMANGGATSDTGQAAAQELHE